MTKSYFAICVACVAVVAGMRTDAPLVDTTGGRLRGDMLPDGGAVFKGIPYAQPPVGSRRWKDTVIVSPEETVRFIMQSRSSPDPSVPCVFYCHILEHEDMGMMGQFVVVADLGADVLIESLVDTSSKHRFTDGRGVLRTRASPITMGVPTSGGIVHALVCS